MREDEARAAEHGERGARIWPDGGRKTEHRGRDASVAREREAHATAATTEATTPNALVMR